MRFLPPLALLACALIVVAFGATVIGSIQRGIAMSAYPECPDEGRDPTPDVMRCRPESMIGSIYDSTIPAVGSCPGFTWLGLFETNKWRWVPETGLCERKPSASVQPAPSFGSRPDSPT